MATKYPKVDIDDESGGANSDLTVVARLARAAEGQAGVVHKGSYQDAADYVILRKGDGSETLQFLSDLPGCQFSPTRKAGTPEFVDQRSFVSYCNYHKLTTPIYGNLKPAIFTAIMNDHGSEAAGARDHRATLKLAFSDEWNTWMGHNGSNKPFGSNEAFALFLEDNAIDIVQPDPTEFLQLALSFKLNEEVSFQSQQRLQDGHVQFAFNKIVTAGGAGSAGNISVPETFRIQIPVFQGVDQLTHAVDARFRFRLRENKLTIWYELIRPHKVLEAAFKLVWDQVKDGTGQEILLGTP